MKVFNRFRLHHVLLAFAGYWLLTGLTDIGSRVYLGTINIPPAGAFSLYNWWGTWWVLLSLVISLNLANNIRPLNTIIRRVERYKITPALYVLVGLLLVMLSLWVKFVLLKGVYLTDDESAYRFAAQALAKGKLVASSFDNKIFFDRVFMINDGDFFPQYFYGWPLILTLGELAGIPFLVNSVAYSLSVIVTFELLCLNVSRWHAIVGALLMACNPLTLMLSATYLSHSTSILAFTLFLYFFHRTNFDQFMSRGFLLMMLGCGGILFMIRPYTAVLACAPFAISLARSAFASGRTFTFVVPSLLIAILVVLAFSALNYSLHKGALTSGYHHYIEYAKENGFVYSFWNGSARELENVPVGFGPSYSVIEFLGSFVAGLQRIAANQMMMPLWVLLVTVCIVVRTHAVYVMSAFLVIAGYAAWGDLGIDTFGPVHLSELAPCLVLMLVTAFSKICDSISSLGKVRHIFLMRAYCKAMLAVIVVLPILCYLPIRLHLSHKIASNIALPYQVADYLGLDDAVVFVGVPFTNQSELYPLHHFRFWRDNPSVSLDDRIIWVNDMGDVQNAQIVPQFPDREFYRMTWPNSSKIPLFEKISN